MQTLQELGAAIATRRQTLGLQQRDVAARAGITQETLSRFERGRTAEFGARKLLAVLAVLDMELDYRTLGLTGSLDELRQERSEASVAYAAEPTPRSPHTRAAKP